MDPSRTSHGLFKQQAFAWRSIFGSRRAELYRYEDRRYVHLPDEDHLATEDLIDRFVHNQCQHDVHRYLYRKRQLSEFLEKAEIRDISTLATEPAPHSCRVIVLIDDRHNGNVTRDPRTHGGSARAPPRPLNAYDLYAELLRPVRKP